ncbi:MAG: MOSC domain-containing protein [Bacteroidota bacterium]
MTSPGNPAQAGALEAIFIAPTAKAPVQSVEAVRAVPGRGLEGDRYWKGEGAFSRWPGPLREVTLIDADALAAAEAEFGVHLSAGEHRRNLVVRGVPLAEWKKQVFTVGAVRLCGVRVCAPCKYLVRVTGQEAIFDALVRRGGLRAEVLTEGTLRVGDAVRPV